MRHQAAWRSHQTRLAIFRSQARHRETGGPFVLVSEFILIGRGYWPVSTPSLKMAVAYFDLGQWSIVNTSTMEQTPSVGAFRIDGPSNGGLVLAQTVYNKGPPRALLAYYYAFIHTMKRYSTSALTCSPICPRL
jgi:hypothetical protein